MQSVQELRRKAQQLKYLASIPTSGGKAADRVLLEIAERMEREAQTRERELLPEQSDFSGAATASDDRQRTLRVGP